MSQPRHTIRVMLFFLVMLMVAPFFISGPDGQPLMTWQKFQQQFFKSLPPIPEAAKALVPDAPKSGQTVYQWKDAKGVWHFTHETPPGEARQVSVVDNRVNIIPGAKPAPKASQSPPPASGEETMSPSQVLEEARRAREGVNQYNRDLEKAVGNM